MSDVSYTHLSSSLTVNLYFQTVRDCISLLVKDGIFMQLKGKKERVKNLVRHSDFFKEQYQIILDAYNNDQNKLESFKKELTRAINCGLKGTHMKTPGDFERRPIMCKGRGCLTCTPYKAVQYCRYTDCITRIVIANSNEAGIDLAFQIKDLIEHQEWSWLVVINTPFSDGTAMVRVSNLREHDMNPLTEDNEVKASMRAIDEAYPMLEPVVNISSDSSIEFAYISGTNNIHFTSSDLYSSRFEGNGNPRESGSKKGFEYSFEEQAVIHMTDIERKKKQESEEGVVGTLNVPSANTEGVSDEILLEAVEEAVDSIVEDDDVALMKANDLPEIKHLTTTFMNTFRGSLEAKGHEQSEIFQHVKIKQEDIDNFYRDYGIANIVIPDNIMEIDYSNHDPSMSFTSFKELVRKLRDNELIKVQRMMKKAMTKKELALHFFEKIKKLH